MYFKASGTFTEGRHLDQ